MYVTRAYPESLALVVVRALHQEQPDAIRHAKHSSVDWLRRVTAAISATRARCSGKNVDAVFQIADGIGPLLMAEEVPM